MSSVFNHIEIWRPFTDIDKSVECLCNTDEERAGIISDLHKCQLDTAQLILEILAKLNLIKHTVTLQNNPWFKFYYNNGSPYLGDLVYYYDLCSWHWSNHGGTGYDLIKKSRGVLAECEYSTNQFEWKQNHAEIHKYLLIQKNPYWYGRFFISSRDKRLISKDIFTNNKPREFTSSEELYQI